MFSKNVEVSKLFDFLIPSSKITVFNCIFLVYDSKFYTYLLVSILELSLNSNIFA